MFIIGLGIAAPPQRYTQRECWSALQKSEPFARLAPRSRAILQKVLCGDNGIATRHLALKPISEVFNLTPDALHARFAKHAPALAVEAAQLALKDAKCKPDEIDAVLISTCTGYLCPNLRAAEAILTASRAGKVLSICVEVCSAAFYLDDDPGVLISACLFGDGAGAAVLANQPQPNRRRVEWKFSSSRLAPDKRDALRFEQKNGMLRNILSPQVPQIAGDEAGRLLNESLVAAGVKREGITGWRCGTSLA